MQTWATYNFKDTLRGNTRSDVHFEVKPGGIPADLTGATISMWLVISSGSVPAAKYSTTNGNIIITDSAAGKFKIVFGKILLQPGIYNHDIKITFADGTEKTWIKGTIKILNTVTP